MSRSGIDPEEIYLVAIWRDGGPNTVMAFEDLGEAARYADREGWEWSHTYLTKIIAGPGPEGRAVLDSILRGNEHPDGCFVAELPPGESADCKSDGHYSCCGCARREPRGDA